MRRLIALILAGAALAPLPAFAADVALKASPSSHGAAVTLGDLFDGAGAASSEVVAPAARFGDQTVLDAARVQVAAKRAGLVWSNDTGQRRIIVASLGGAPAATTGAPSSPRRASAGRRANQALAYARNINPGELLDASDLVWSDEAVAPSDAPSDADAVIGKAARRPLRAGAAVGVHDLASPKLIKRDDLVVVAFEDGGVSLTLQAKATADAGMGDTLNLINLRSTKTLEAVCTGPDRAVVGPAADRMRSDVFDTRRYAAR